MISCGSFQINFAITKNQKTLLNILYLINPVLGLKVRIVSCPDRSHGRGFVSGVGLSRVLEVRIRTAGTVDANVAGHADVRTTMGLAHDCDNSDLKSEKKPF